MGTIGYGALYPATPAANVIVVAESLTGLIFTAVATGMVFAKFSRMRARFLYADKAVVAPLNGVPTLMIRVGNERGNLIVDAQIRMAIGITEKSTEGTTMYRNYDLKPVRERLLSLSRAWTVMHAIDETSPLRGHNHDTLVEKEAEIFLTIIGLDDATMSPIHAQARYFPQDIVWGARYVDMLSETPEGNMLLDLTKFHQIRKES
jgi:inward rectifier potassium channel